MEYLNPYQVLSDVKMSGMESLERSPAGSYWELRRARSLLPAHLMCVLVLSLVALFALPSLALAQGSGGVNPSSRLKYDVKNEYRGGVRDAQEVQNNIRKLFPKISEEGLSSGEADTWFEPHLRDMNMDQGNRNMEAKVRGDTVPNVGVPLWEYCMNPFNRPIEAACPLLPPGGGPEICIWHGDRFGPHRPIEACYGGPTTRYKSLVEDYNFKFCCVKAEDKKSTSEQIVVKYRDGKGWAGLFEYYYPTAVLGWENDRLTTMIVDKQKVQRCKDRSDPLMENQNAQKWVAEAIARNAETAGGSANSADLERKVQGVIDKVRPQNKDLRFTDSLQSEGLTLRVNLLAMEREYRKAAAERFCMHPEQFNKLMVPDPSGVNGDPLQRDKGGLSLGELDQIPVWSNYCPEGVNLMTDPQKSAGLTNPDNTPTKLNVGMKVWQQDPLYCQRMNLENPNMALTRIGEVVQKAKGLGMGGYSEQRVGYTCLSGGKLNGGMVPVSLHRHAAVERRTAIADHAVGFLIAGALAPGMTNGFQSYYKRFEPQAYSADLPDKYKLFNGQPFTAGAGKINERGDPCNSIRASIPRLTNKSDRLYLSNKTHESFTQSPIDESNPINKYVQEWAEAEPEKIANREFDEKSLNYAAAFRMFATCPAGYVVWDPPQDEHNSGLKAHIEQWCRVENFGGTQGGG